MKTYFLVRRHDGCPDVYFKRFFSSWDKYGLDCGVIPTCDRTEAHIFTNKIKASQFKKEHKELLEAFEIKEVEEKENA